MAIQRNALVDLIWTVHPYLYRWTSGRVGGYLMNMPVLLLTTTGRRSGHPRTQALLYLADGDNYVVIASCLGAPQHPAWCLNLRAHPTAEVQIGAQRIPVIAQEADGATRQWLWDVIVARQPEYAAYQQRTTRRIPIVVLTPQAL